MICCDSSYGFNAMGKRNNPCCYLVASCQGGTAEGLFRQAIEIDAGGKSSGKFTARDGANSGSGNVVNRYLKRILAEVCTTSAVFAIVPRDCSRLNRNSKRFGRIFDINSDCSRDGKRGFQVSVGSLSCELS